QHHIGKKSIWVVYIAGLPQGFRDKQNKDPPSCRGSSPTDSKSAFLHPEYLGKIAGERIFPIERITRDQFFDYFINHLQRRNVRAGHIPALSCGFCSLEVTTIGILSRLRHVNVVSG